MVAFNFNKQFVEKIQSGEKHSTIRSTKRCKVGDTMQLYTGQRTKDCRKIADAVCIGLAQIEIKKDKFWRIISWPEGIIYATEDKCLHRQEGFQNVLEFIGFFEKTYGLPYTGWLHVWALNPE